MCGILGRFSFVNSGFSPEIFAKALSLLDHRGPDNTGRWTSENRKVMLGHKRLSIIDLSSSGNQPMQNNEKNLVIVYNGEFYNFRELRESLEIKGYTFNSNCDTEVLLYGYQEYGESILEKIRGMYSFAIYNTENGELFFARDRMGIKPFYYSFSDNCFSFSSEIKPLLTISENGNKIKRRSALEFLAFGSIYEPNTMFENICKLPAAHYGLVKPNGEIAIKRYWTPYDNEIDFKNAKSEEDYASVLFDLFEESVNYRLISDVPVGVFLSGGVDSSGILGMIKYLGKTDKIFTYNTGFLDNSKYDESEYAISASKYYKTNHFQTYLKQEELFDELPTIIKHLDEPISDPTVIPIYYLSKMARNKGSIVLLNGDGADELFAGYEKWIKYLKFKKFWDLLNITPNVFKELFKKLLNTKNHHIAGDIVNRSIMRTEFFIGDTGAFKASKLYDELITEDFFKIFTDEKKDFDKMNTGNDYVEWVSYWGLKSLVGNVFLYRSDRLGMANSIEIRVPYLDKRIVEFAMQMPQRLKYKNNTPKYILKKALEKIVPNEFLYRRKMGFCVPVNEWIDKRMHDEVINNLGILNDYVFNLDASRLGVLKDQIKSELINKKSDLIFDFFLLINWLMIWT